MNATLDLFTPSGPKRVGQGTAIEQSRASTEVQGAIYIARQFPRDMEAAKRRMLMACAQPELAEKAFYSYPRGGEDISGLTIEAACELALCWGNFEYGLTEMRRDDEFGQSESLAWSWDLETNVRISNAFIAPHTRETKGGGSKRVNGARDIYEVITNYGNRRMRAAILKNLPRWFKIQAESAFRDTLKQMVETAEVPFTQQLEQALNDFKKRYGVTADQIGQKARKPVANWNSDDLVKLRILWNTLDRGEITPELAFPEAKVTPEEILNRNPASAPAPQRQDPDLHLHPEGCDCAACQHFGLTPGPDGAKQRGHVDAPVSGCPLCQAESAEADRAAEAES